MSKPWGIYTEGCDGELQRCDEDFELDSNYFILVRKSVPKEKLMGIFKRVLASEFEAGYKDCFNLDLNALTPELFEFYVESGWRVLGYDGHGGMGLIYDNVTILDKREHGYPCWKIRFDDDFLAIIMPDKE